MSARLAKGDKGTRGGKRGGRRRKRTSAHRYEGESLEALRVRWRRPELHLYSSIDSTSGLGRELAEAGAPDGTLVLADEQTAGRGRGDHRWVSPKGAGLYFSLVVRPEGATNLTLFPVLAGLGVLRALNRLASETRPALKWPNDILLAGRKGGGVLVEAASDGARTRHAVVGIGLNVRTKPGDLPKELREVATSVEAELGRPVARLDLLDAILAELEPLLHRAGETLDSELMRDLDAYDWLRDRRCAIVEPESGTELPGVAVGIAPDGALLFRPDSGPLKRVVSGHVAVPELPLPNC